MNIETSILYFSKAVIFEKFWRLKGGLATFFSILSMFSIFSEFFQFLTIFRIFHFPRFQWHSIIDQKLEFLSRLKARFLCGLVQKLWKNGGRWTILFKFFLFAEGSLKVTECFVINIFREKGHAKTLGFRRPQLYFYCWRFPRQFTIYTGCPVFYILYMLYMIIGIMYNVYNI